MTCQVAERNRQHHSGEMVSTNLGLFCMFVCDGFLNKYYVNQPTG